VESLDGAARGRLQGVRILFFGLGGVFSRLPLEALLRAGADVRAVVTPAQPGLALAASQKRAAPFIRLEPPRLVNRRALPLVGAALPARSLRDLAAEATAPLLSVSRLSDAETLAALAAFAPDAICVACFTRRLPPALLALPHLGCLNAHPSLLPDNRGPDPLFWTFHAGAATTGVTIHLMDDGLDTGPMLAQTSVALAEGETEAALEARLATLAGVQMVAALAGLISGALTPTAQDVASATFHSWPSASDYIIPATWTARRAFTFARGVVGRGEPMTLIASDGVRFRLVAPLSYEPLTTPAKPWRLDGDCLTLACAPGALICHVGLHLGNAE
jgi:methionyl-tRNA formyltransferase